MGIFDLFKSSTKNDLLNNVYVRKKDIKGHLNANKRILSELRKHGVTEDKSLKIEYFFYTNAKEKADALAEKIKELNYSVLVSSDASDNTLWVITGWTNKIKISEAELATWTKEMCEIGYYYDCDFDGWGTNVNEN